MVGEAVHSWLKIWREWLGCAHLSGMYPSLLYNRGFDACSTRSRRLLRASLSSRKLVWVGLSHLVPQAPASVALYPFCVHLCRYTGAWQIVPLANELPVCVCCPLGLGS